MTRSSQKNRIIFIDLMRAFAVLMMVQGHTTDVLLANDSRNLDNPIFAVWLFMRGMTAPIFLFTSGTVFTYLFRLNNEPFGSNPRVYKGFKRFLLLVFLGYMLRFPTPTLINFSGISESQWRIFFAVDVLHLIGFGLLFIIIASFIAEKLKLSDYTIFSFAGMLFFILYLFFEQISWLNYLPVPLAGYFYKGTGSNFPLFPWAGYVLMGGVLGSFLAKNPEIFKTIRFSIYLAAAGAVFLLASLAGHNLEGSINAESYRWSASIYLIFMRLGFVLVLTALVSYISLTINTIPKLLILVGRNTLLIYVAHLIILYGSAWNPGIITLYGRALNGFITAAAALFMLSLMVGIVILIHKFKIKNKQIVT